MPGFAGASLPWDATNAEPNNRQLARDRLMMELAREQRISKMEVKLSHTLIEKDLSATYCESHLAPTCKETIGKNS